MSTTKYANAVAAVKAMENTLLTHGDMEQLISVSGSAEADALISAKKGGETSSPEKVWEFVKSCAPESQELEILLYKNDFHNLKAALKAMIAGRTAEKYYIRPTNIDLGSLTDILTAKDYESLPKHIAKAAEEGYEILVKTSDGQIAESCIDRLALEAMQSSAEESGSDFMKKFAELNTVCADIKTAFRCCKMKKSKSFLENALCGSRELDKESLVNAALDGMEALLGYLEDSSYAEPVRLLKASPAQFEKWCDDVIMELAETARMQSFGAEPLAAYYIAAEAEQKNIRIITVCKEFGADRETITERMRRLYV